MPITKIFIPIPWFLPAFRAGGPVQSIANLVKEYRDDVAYFIFCSDVDLNGAALEDIVTGEWVSYNDSTKIWYAAPEKISDTMVKQVEIIKPDVLFIIGIFSWHFNIVPLLYCKAPKKILSTRGMLHPGALSQKRWKKRIYLRLFKLLEYQHKVQFHATDEEEHRYISKYFSGIPEIFTAGNFPNKINALPFLPKQPGHLKLISVAVISPMKNILLVLQALGQVNAEIQYNIYGPVKDRGYLEKCEQQIKKLPPNIKVVIHKEIKPDKLKEALSSAHVFVLPSKSENFGHAIYEALSAGRPVITSYNTPWSKLRLSFAGINISVEDTHGLTEAINFFADIDEQALLKWQQGAIDYSEKAIDMEKIRSGYKAMFSSGTR
ncbi:MAG: glycosyltransferase [Bacteroidota bacterium]|nr:glycosyltransferase [Bacteroidota bacterium]